MQHQARFFARFSHRRAARRRQRIAAAGGVVRSIEAAAGKYPRTTVERELRVAPHQQHFTSVGSFAQQNYGCGGICDRRLWIAHVLTYQVACAPRQRFAARVSVEFFSAGAGKKDIE